MRRIELLRYVLVCAAFVFQGNARSQDAPVLWPTVKVGDRWTYRLTDWGSVRDVFELRVTFVGQDAIQAVSLMRKTGQEIDTSWTPEWNAVTDQRGGSFFPDSGWLRFPLKPGVTYPVEFEIRRPFRDPVPGGSR